MRGLRVPALQLAQGPTRQIYSFGLDGTQTAIGGVRDVWKITPLEIIGERIIPAVAEF